MAVLSLFQDGSKTANCHNEKPPTATVTTHAHRGTELLLYSTSAPNSLWHKEEKYQWYNRLSENCQSFPMKYGQPG